MITLISTSGFGKTTKQCIAICDFTEGQNAILKSIGKPLIRFDGVEAEGENETVLSLEKFLQDNKIKYSKHFSGHRFIHDGDNLKVIKTYTEHVVFDGKLKDFDFHKKLKWN